jgi:transcriptional regulator
VYIPKHYEERDIGVLHALIRSNPLGAWVTEVEGALAANHIPFLVDSTAGERGMLIGHVARANPIWRSFSRTTASLIVFQGPQSYITPSWYPSKHADGKAVPTWNYAVVHVHGAPRAIEDPEWLRRHVTALTSRHESDRTVPWQVTDAPADYVDAMLKAIVGIEIPIDAIVGKWKASQNRSPADKQAIIAGLQERGGDEAREMAALIRRHADPGED